MGRSQESFNKKEVRKKKEKKRKDKEKKKLERALIPAFTGGGVPAKLKLKTIYVLTPARIPEPIITNNNPNNFINVIDSPKKNPIKAAIAVNIKSKNGETIILVFKP